MPRIMSTKWHCSSATAHARIHLLSETLKHAWCRAGSFLPHNFAFLRILPACASAPSSLHPVSSIHWAHWIWCSLSKSKVACLLASFEPAP